jgi:hypothetical protein
MTGIGLLVFSLILGAIGNDCLVIYLGGGTGGLLSIYR